jgi:phage gp29-like protein
MGLFDRIFPKGPDNNKLIEMAVRNQRKKNDLLEKIIQMTNYRSKQDIERWRMALQMAENWDMPRRTNLYNLYDEVILDAHLYGVIENQRKLRVLAFDFRIVDKEGNTDDALTDYFQQSWFRDFCNHVLDADYYGHSLVQIHVNNGRPVVELIPRRHVEPQRGYLLKYPFDFKGPEYRGVWDDVLIEAGKPLDLGLLNKAAPLVLFKRNAMQAWSEYADIFGMPVRIGKTNTNRKEDLDRMENALADMGKAAYAVFGMGEEIQFVESHRTAGEMVYDRMMERINSELSKLILGSTMTVDVGKSGSRAQAEVHETAADDVIDADKLRLRYLINDKLIPLLKGQGITGLDGKLFAWEEAKDLNKLWEWTAKSLDHYKISPEWITDTFGIPVEEKEAQTPSPVTLPPAQQEPRQRVNNVLMKMHEDIAKLYTGKDHNHIEGSGCC